MDRNYRQSQHPRFLTSENDRGLESSGPIGESAVKLDIDGAVQNFTATDVHVDDIETYRSK